MNKNHRKQGIPPRLVEMPRRDDVVLVAGKGHETVQVGAEGAQPFDDRRVVVEEWA